MLQLYEIKVSILCQAILSVTEQINGDTAIVSVQEGQEQAASFVSCRATLFVTRNVHTAPCLNSPLGGEDKRGRASEGGREGRGPTESPLSAPLGKMGEGRKEGEHVCFRGGGGRGGWHAGSKAWQGREEGRKPQQPSPPPSFIRRSYKS